MSAVAIDMLEEAAATLRTQLATQTTGEARYLALLSANAVAMAAREWRMADRLGETATIDIAAIRTGRHDDDLELFAELQRRQAVQAWIADPGQLDDAERARFIDGAGS